MRSEHLSRTMEDERKRVVGSKASGGRNVAVLSGEKGPVVRPSVRRKDVKKGRGFQEKNGAGRGEKVLVVVS